MDTVRVSLELTLQDWQALRIGYLRRYRRTISKGGSRLVAYVQRYCGRKATPDKDSAFFGPCTFEIGADGLRTLRPGVSASYSWGKIRDIDRIADTLILWTDRLSGIAVPLRGLPNGMTPDQLERLIRDRTALQSGQSVGSAVDHGDTAIEAADKVRFASGTAVLLRLWALRRVADLRGVATDASVICLGFASLALWVGLDRWRAGSGAQFELWDTLTICFYVMLVLGVAFVLSRASRPRLSFRSVLFILVSGLPILIGVGFLIDVGLDGRAALTAWVLLCLYALGYSSKALHGVSGGWQMRATLAAIVLVSVFCAYGEVTELSPTLWSPSSAGEEDSGEMDASVAEGLLFDQRAQIDDAVDRMTEPAGASPAVFFVGFAGVASQRVFAEEIKLAAHVVDDRFEISDRQLLLINDRRDLDTYPIATASGLSYALRAVGEKMDPERDILFLALSSHGSDDPLLAVSIGSMQLEQLSGDDLDAALRDSGIKWRIIVISACYAGAFMKPLQNPNTIVITAAAADKTSFGCSDDRDMTYFGEAFYRDALPAASTLQEAFERAKAAIAAREKQENETASDPQAFFGREISAMLERYPMRTGRHGEIHAAL